MTPSVFFIFLWIVTHPHIVGDLLIDTMGVQTAVVPMCMTEIMHMGIVLLGPLVPTKLMQRTLLFPYIGEGGSGQHLQVILQWYQEHIHPISTVYG